jgi:hypothetical protein
MNASLLTRPRTSASTVGTPASATTHDRIGVEHGYRVRKIGRSKPIHRKRGGCGHIDTLGIAPVEQSFHSLTRRSLAIYQREAR